MSSGSDGPTEPVGDAAHDASGKGISVRDRVARCDFAVLATLGTCIY